MRKCVAERVFTEEVLAAFRRAIELQPIYADCTGALECLAPPGSNEHCDTCLAYLEADNALTLGLGLRPWHENPLNVDCAEPPPHVARSPVAARDWAAAWALRQLLEDAAARRDPA